MIVERVGIIGVGQSVHARSRPDVAHAELVLEAVDEALADAGVELAQIDNAVTACIDVYDGRTIANMSLAEVVGSYLTSESRVCADGAAALVYAWARIADGGFDLGLVTAHCKESEGNLHDIEAAGFDPFYERRLDIDGDVVAALYARELLDRGSLDLEAAARVVARGRALSQRHPRLTPLDPVGADEVLAADPLADPLRILDKAPRSDGSGAVVIASESTVRRMGVPVAWITGTSTVIGKYWSDRAPDDLTALESADERARLIAGWNGARADVVEVSGQFSYQTVQFARTLGYDTDDEAVNPSGGWHAGNPITVTGMSRVIEGVHHLRGTAGDRQIAGATKALAHGVTGIGAQGHAIITLEAG